MVKKYYLLAFFSGLFWLVVLAGGIFSLRYLSYNNDHWLEDSNEFQQARTFLAEEFEPYENSVIIFPANDLFTRERIKKINLFSDSLLTIEGVNSIRSPLEANLIVHTPESLWIESYRKALEAGIIKTPQQFRSELRASPWYGKVISHDFSRAAIIVQQTSLNMPEERSRIIEEIKQKMAGDSFFSQAVLTGDAVLKNRLDEATEEELFFLLPLSGFLLMLFLYILLGRFWKLLLVSFSALICTLVAVLWIVFQGHALTTISLILLIMLSVIAIADSLHVLVFWDHLCKTTSNLSRRQLLTKTFHATWLPCLSTSVTTAFGFGMFYFSDLIPFQNFASDAFVSILAAFPIMMIILFSGLLVAPIQSSTAPKGYVGIFFDYMLEKLWSWGKQYGKPILVTVALLFCLAVGSLTIKGHSESNLLNVYFEPDSPFHKSFTTLDKFFSGSGSLDILISSGEEGFFRDISIFEVMQDITKIITPISGILSIESYLISISEVHKALSSENGPYPTKSEELSQEILFIEFSRNDKDTDILADFVNFDYSTGHIRIRTPNLSSSEMKKLVQKIKDATQIFVLPGQVITGHSVFFSQISDYVISTQFISVTGTILLILLILVVQFGWRLSSLGMIATTFPVFLVLGVMALFGVPFDVSTVVIASIALGLSVDDAVHILHRYKHYSGSGEDEKRLRQSFFIPGRAILQTSFLFTIAAGTFLFSDLVLLKRFGFFTLLAFLLALFSASILLIILLRHYATGNKQEAQS